VSLPPIFRQIFVQKFGNAAHLVVVVHQCAVPVTAFSDFRTFIFLTPECSDFWITVSLLWSDYQWSESFLLHNCWT
jgi:hypothetical protein